MRKECFEQRNKATSCCGVSWCSISVSCVGGGWIRLVTGENRKIGGTLLWSGYFVITIDQASPHLACTGVGLLYDVKQRQIKIHFFRIICYRLEVLELFNSFLNLLCYFSSHQYPTHACAFPNFDCDVLTFFAFMLPSSGQGIKPRLSLGSAVRERWRRQIRDLCCIQHISQSTDM